MEFDSFDGGHNGLPLLKMSEIFAMHDDFSEGTAACDLVYLYDIILYRRFTVHRCTRRVISIFSKLFTPCLTTRLMKQACRV